MGTVIGEVTQQVLLVKTPFVQILLKRGADILKLTFDPNAKNCASNNELEESKSVVVKTHLVGLERGKLIHCIYVGKNVKIS